jgi:hypothetical protein
MKQIAVTSLGDGSLSHETLTQLAQNQQTATACREKKVNSSSHIFYINLKTMKKRQQKTIKNGKSIKQELKRSGYLLACI